MSERLEITLAIVFATLGLLLIAWALYRHRLPSVTRTVVKTGIVGVIISTFLWAILAWEIPGGWLYFALFGALVGAISGVIVVLARYNFAS